MLYRFVMAMNKRFYWKRKRRRMFAFEFPIKDMDGGFFISDSFSSQTERKNFWILFINFAENFKATLAHNPFV